MVQFQSFSTITSAGGGGGGVGTGASATVLMEPGGWWRRKWKIKVPVPPGINW